MKITVYETVPKTIELKKGQMKKVTEEYLELLVHPGEYLRKDKKTGKLVVKMDDPYHRHGSISEEYVRDATELDIAIFNMLDLLRSIIKD